jgi:hypothetical protein
VRILGTLLFFCCSAVFAFDGGAIPPLALVVLDTAKPSAGRFPDGWELKVKSGQPDVSTTKDGDAMVLHFKNVKSSFSLEKSVDLDAAKMPYLAWHLENASSPPLIHIYAIVCRSGMADANRWVAESHNVAADYLKAFGRRAPQVTGLRLQINSQHTGSAAESYFADLVFRNTAQ